MKLAFQLLRTDVCVLVTQSCPTLCNPTNCSLPVFSVHGILGQEYWSGLPFPSLEDLLDPGIKLWSPADFLPSEPPKPYSNYRKYKFMPLL